VFKNGRPDTWFNVANAYGRRRFEQVEDDAMKSGHSGSANTRELDSEFTSSEGVECFCGNRRGLEALVCRRHSVGMPGLRLVSVENAQGGKQRNGYRTRILMAYKQHIVSTMRVDSI